MPKQQSELAKYVRQSQSKNTQYYVTVPIEIRERIRKRKDIDWQSAVKDLIVELVERVERELPKK